MATVPGVGEYCTRDPHFEGKEVFGSQSQMFDLPPGSQNDSHRPDKVNFSRPHGGTRLPCPSAFVIPLDTISEEALLHALDEEIELQISVKPMDAFPSSEACQVTSVRESACDESQWHIA